MRTPLVAAALALLVWFGPAIPLVHAESPTAAEFLQDALGPELYARLDAEQLQALLRYAEALLAAPLGSPVLTRCFSPEVPRDFVRAFHTLEEADRARREAEDDGPALARQLENRWTATAIDGGSLNTQGQPITLTWSIVPDGTPIPGDASVGDPDGPSELREHLRVLYGGSATGPAADQPWFVHFQTVFDNVSAKTGVSYVYEPNDDGAEVNNSNSGQVGVRGDVRICGHEIDGGPFSNGTLAYNYYPNRGDMVIDTRDDWLEDNIANPNAITNLIEHEHGHGLGLAHVCPDDGTKLMEPFINRSFRGIQLDDIYGLQRHYGDFYEKHNSVRNNDNPTNATPLEVIPGTPFAFEWLSIDDNSDSDYLSLNLVAGALITVRVIPSDAIYPEGPENGSCSASGSFDSTSQQNLSLALLAPNKSTVLATGPGLPAGQTEAITNFEAPLAGTHYLRILGSGADACQLYRLEVEVENPSALLDLTGIELAAESFSGANGAPDPGETLRYDLTLTGVGALTAENPRGVLTGPPGFTGFVTEQDFDDLAPGGTSKRSFIFALEGDCGETLDLSLEVTADGAEPKTFPFSLTLGIVEHSLQANADASTFLPAGWTSTVTDAGVVWSVGAIQSVSPPRSFYGQDVGSAGSSSLHSPVLALGPEPATLRFAHSYNTEVGYDGGVLEISIDGGAWTDILAAGGTFLTYGYNTTLNSGLANLNPLKGRMAWSGNSLGFVTTEVLLPASSRGQPTALRWRIGHDDSVDDEGWYVDDIDVSSTTCDASGPVLTLSASDPVADEFAPLDTATLSIATSLPPLHPIPLTLLAIGTADPVLDVSGLESLVFPAGQTDLDIVVTALPDGLVEGPETLALTLDQGLGSATLTINDSPYGQWAFTLLGAGPLTGPGDDFDADRLSNLEEYTRQTNPTAFTPTPDLASTVIGDHFRIDAPFATLPPDVRLGAESSLDLLLWSDDEVQSLPDGFQVPRSDPHRFLRLTYQLLPAAP